MDAYPGSRTPPEPAGPFRRPRGLAFAVPMRGPVLPVIPSGEALRARRPHREHIRLAMAVEDLGTLHAGGACDARAAGGRFAATTPLQAP